MVDSEIVEIVDELEALGVKFTVIPRLDCSLRLNCWRAQNSWQYRERINQLLAERIERFPERSAQIAEFVSRRSAAAVEHRSTD